MFKAAIVLLSTVTALSFTCAAHAKETQKWECAVNLHQGDNGTLSIDRTGDDVTGMLSIKRNASVFENEINGRWTDNQINIQRFLDSDSNDLMAGVVVPLGTKKVKIGGRFSADYQGVWSADCDLVSSSASADKSSSNIIEPSTTSRITPSKPSNKDRVTFSATANHPDGIQSMSFFIDDKKAHTCESNRCEFSKPSLSKGIHSWYVQAVSKSGAKNKIIPNRLTVRSAQTKKSCSISGHATGPSADLSAIYLVTLLGPNNDKLFHASTEFKNNFYQFSGLPEGLYTVSIDTRADKAVIASPLSTKLDCNANRNATLDFSLH